jgi:hypothetical protein
MRSSSKYLFSSFKAEIVVLLVESVHGLIVNPAYSVYQEMKKNSINGTAKWLLGLTANF